MLQRKQTLFLILIIALFVPLFFMDLVTLELYGLPEVGDKIYTISTRSVYPLAILASLVVVLSVATIALFKKNTLQLRLAVMNIVLIFGYIGMEIYSIWRFQTTTAMEVQEAVSSNFSIGMASFFALPALLLAFLSFRGIAKDIFLLRSFNRMR